MSKRALEKSSCFFPRLKYPESLTAICWQTKDAQNHQPEHATMSDRTFEIDIEDHMGFVRVLMGRGEPTGELAQFLSATLAGWIQQHPEVRILAVVPINRDGDTVELHAWFELRD